MTEKPEKISLRCHNCGSSEPSFDNRLRTSSKQAGLQNLTAILPFDIMCNIPNIMCNTTFQYHYQLIYLLQISYRYCFSVRLIHWYIYYSIVFILMLLVFSSNLWHNNFLWDELSSIVSYLKSLNMDKMCIA